MDNTRVKIERFFSDAVYDDFKIKKYGIKSCRFVMDPICAYMLKELYKNKKERFDCDSDSESCTYSQVKELINIL